MDWWTDGKIVRLSDGANLLFIALLNQADDEGKLKNDQKEIECKAPRFWGRAGELLQELGSVGLIEVYGETQEFIQIKNFLKHQRIDKAKDSEIPNPRTIQEQSKNNPRMDRIGKEVIGKDSKEKNTVSPKGDLGVTLKKGKEKTAPDGYEDCMRVLSKRWTVRGASPKIDGQHGKIIKKLLGHYGFTKTIALIALFGGEEWEGWGKKNNGLNCRGFQTDLEKMLDSDVFVEFERNAVAKFSKPLPLVLKTGGIVPVPDKPLHERKPPDFKT